MSLIGIDPEETADELERHGEYPAAELMREMNQELAQLRAKVREAAEAPSRYEGASVPCPHCPDGHQRPDWGRWSVWVSGQRDGDGQPGSISVSRPDGAHVAEADAEWIRDVLNGRAAHSE